MAYVLVLPLAYLIGSISWGLIIGKITRGIDVRKYGSGATGMTNVMRTLGLKVALVVLVLDVLKGLSAVLIAKIWIGTPMGEALAGILVIAGHNWPIFGKFQGGRGVLTGVGGLILVSPLDAAISLAVFLPTVAISKYVSLGSVMAVSTSIIIMAVFVATGLEPWEAFIYTGVGGALILWRHRQNIRRLLAGNERRLGEKTEVPTEPNPEGQQ